MKLKLQEWNDVVRALQIANKELTKEANTIGRSNDLERKHSDAAFSEAARYDELSAKIGKELLS